MIVVPPVSVNASLSPILSSVMASDQKHIKKTVNLCCSFMGKLKRHRSPDITTGDMAKMGIKCAGLNLKTGQPDDGSKPFIIPYAQKTIDEVLQKTRPWEDVELVNEKNPWSLRASQEVAYLLKRYLTWSAIEELEDPLVETTPWIARNMDVDKFEYLYSSLPGREFRGSLVMDMEDANYPHMACFLADETPFKSDCLTLSEMWCVLALTNSRFVQDKYRKFHRIFPITIIHCYSRTLRIVQAYVDFAEECIFARKSDPIDLEVEDREKVKLLLSWLLGTPVGDTKLHKPYN